MKGNKWPLKDSTEQNSQTSDRQVSKARYTGGFLKTTVACTVPLATLGIPRLCGENQKVSEGCRANKYALEQATRTCVQSFGMPAEKGTPRENH